MLTSDSYTYGFESEATINFIQMNSYKAVQTLTILLSLDNRILKVIPNNIKYYLSKLVSKTTKHHSGFKTRKLYLYKQK